MEESTKKFSNQSSNWFKNVMALFQYIWVSTLLAILQGTEITGTTQEDHQMLVVSYNS
jgi:hypothetical protein